MILDFGTSFRRYYVAAASLIWTNGAPGGAIIPVISGRYVGFVRDVGRLMNP